MYWHLTGPKVCTLWKVHQNIAWLILCQLQGSTVTTTQSVCLFAFIGAAESVRTTTTFCTQKLGSVTPPSGLSMWNHKQQQNPRWDVELMTRLNIFPGISFNLYSSHRVICCSDSFRSAALGVKWTFCCSHLSPVLVVGWTRDESSFTPTVCFSMRFSSAVRRLLLLRVRSFILLLVLTDSHQTIQHQLAWDPASGFRDGPGLQLLNILLCPLNISDTLYSLLCCDDTSATLAIINTSCLCCLGPVAALFFCRWDL